ncbi:Retrovirus-related Pol polyprotein from transposon TNT 1-94 [Vitis vinifera]|uniref:Retrovirus-related Pol polyprotein from transposon TNT 1-94 n=1 Tax=Vitis vinifera TaxID=29760 RepID=A0A438CF10_VITVI|nr:Retrovirus-related Pol polyprotein from transposon TNT 1-94 [Vitis vinifera]
MDVKTAFLNGDLSEEVYMSQPEGFKENGKENMVCRLKRSIMVSSKLLTSGSWRSIFVLGIEIYRDRSRNLLGLSQKAYINRVLKRFNMQTCKAGDVPVVKGDKLICTRLDITFIVNVLGRYLSNPGHDHWVAAKKVMRYLQRTKDFMLVYRRVDNLEVVGYSDSDFGGCSDDRKSTSGYIFMLAGGAISWKSVKQSLIASSTMHAEFVACYGLSSQAVWLRNLISELQVVDSIFRPIVIYCDNNAAVFYSKNNKISTGSKHMEIKYLTVKDLVKKEIL